MKTIFNYTELRNCGYKLTPQRRIILDVMRNAPRHLSADDIYIKVRKISPSIGLTTVYRTLQVLADLGWINKYDFGQGKAKYEPSETIEEEVNHHHHIICTKCKEVVDYTDFVKMEMALIKETQMKIEKKYGFNVQTHNIEFIGVCKKCRNKNKEAMHRG